MIDNEAYSRVIIRENANKTQMMYVTNLRFTAIGVSCTQKGNEDEEIFIPHNSIVMIHSQILKEDDA